MASETAVSLLVVTQSFFWLWVLAAARSNAGNADVCMNGIKVGDGNLHALRHRPK